MDTIVRPRVRMLKVEKVCFMALRGFVSALEFAASKNAWIFSMESGKNYA